MHRFIAKLKIANTPGPRTSKVLSSKITVTYLQANHRLVNLGKPAKFCVTFQSSNFGDINSRATYKIQLCEGGSYYSLILSTPNCNKNMGVSKNNGTPKSSIFNRVFHYKPSILGYPYFWKHPYACYTSSPLKFIAFLLRRD